MPPSGSTATTSPSSTVTPCRRSPSKPWVTESRSSRPAITVLLNGQVTKRFARSTRVTSSSGARRWRYRAQVAPPNPAPTTTTRPPRARARARLAKRPATAAVPASLRRSRRELRRGSRIISGARPCDAEAIRHELEVCGAVRRSFPVPAVPIHCPARFPKRRARASISASVNARAMRFITVASMSPAR